MTAEDLEMLYDQLVALCLYNDTGHAMMEHTPAEMANVRKQFRHTLDLFVQRVGEDNVPREILNELKSDFVLEDGQGIVLGRLNAFFPRTLTDPFGIDAP